MGFLRKKKVAQEAQEPVANPIDDLILLVELPWTEENSIASNLPVSPEKAEKIAPPSPDRTAATINANEHDEDNEEFEIPYRRPLSEENKLNRNKRSMCKKLLLILIACILVAIAGGGVAALYFTRGIVSEDSNSEDSRNNQTGETIEEQRAFRFITSMLYGSNEDYLADPNSPEFKAIDFMAQEYQTMTLNADEIKQRFALLSVFFTSGRNSWIQSFDFATPNLHECRWNDFVEGEIRGAACDKDQMVVTYISIPQNNVSGTLPKEIGLLENLKHLDLSFNQITGPIPDNFSALREMRHLSLAGNKLNGEVPSSLDQEALPDLNYFSIENNQLFGDISPLCVDDDTDIRADCMGDNAEISCSCCSLCCIVVNGNTTCE